jgi:hypothetical protein
MGMASARLLEVRRLESLGTAQRRRGFMKRSLWWVGVVALASVLLTGCQKKEVTTTETQKTTEGSSATTTPESTTTQTETTTTTTTSSPAPTPGP